MSKSPMTKIGAEKLREQLHELKTIERPRITAAIPEARAHGDLSENAEYHAAREQQIIDVRGISERDKIVFGATVTILNIDSN